jgi:hypothetical protein
LNPAAAAPTLEDMDNPAGGSVMRSQRDSMAEAMHDADFVLIDGIVCETEYLRVPDEFTVPDDVVLEAKHGDTEFAFTRADFDGAQHLGDGVFRLSSGRQLRFFSSATIH